MRRPDVIIDGQTHIWRVPMQPLYQWVREHAEKMPRYARGSLFEKVWRDLWYVRAYVHGGDYDDELAESVWFAVILRDLRNAPDVYPRMYVEAEWELAVEELERAVPPLNGEGLYDQLDQPPTFAYQFHGLSEERVMDVGSGESFAIFGWQMIARGRRPIGDVAMILSMQVNDLRVRDGLEPLQIATGRDPFLGIAGGLRNAGLLCTLDDGSPVTETARVSQPG